MSQSIRVWFGVLVVFAASPVAAAEPEELFAISAERGGFISSTQFSADGKTILTLGTKPLIGVWDAKTGKSLRQVELTGTRFVSALSPDGSRAAVLGEGAVSLWDVAKGEKLVELKGHEKGVVAVGFSPDGNRVVTASEDKTAKVWDAKTGKLVATLTGHTLTVASAEFSADGKRVATGSYNGAVKVWDAESGKELADLKGMSTSNNPTMFSADGKLVVSPRMDSPAVWSVAEGKLIQEFKGHKSWCRTARFDPAGEKLVTAGLDKTARVWDVKTGQEVHSLKHEGEVRFAAFSPDGTRVVTLSGGKARVWQLPAAK